MIALNCPNCGAEIVFGTAALPVKVCEHCRTIVVRRGQSAENVGTVAELPFDVSPLKIGTRGEWAGEGFEIIGRVRWSWEDGAWNEWFLALQGGGTRWLGEAMGQLMVTEERPSDDLDPILGLLAQGKDVVIGQEALIYGVRYRLVDQRSVRCVSSEGELPFTAPTGWTAFSADFRSGQGDFASLQRDGRECRLYVGRYVDLAELKPDDLRILPGWETPAYG